MTFIGPYKRVLHYSFHTGAITLSFQLSFLREFLLTFQGNELVIGIFLAVWMLLTGTGVALEKTAKKISGNIKYLMILQALLSLMPMVSYLTFGLLKKFVIIAGSMPGINESVIFSLVTLSPACILSGYLFGMYCRNLYTVMTNPVSKVYIFDVLGSILGGCAINFFLIYYLDPIIILMVLLTTNLIYLAAISYRMKSRSVAALSILILIIVIPFYFISNNLKNNINSNIIEEVNSPYGRITVTKTGEQYNFFDNGNLLFSTGYANEVEENVHFTMAQHTDPHSVLMISGGASGMLPEVLKYKPSQIDYIELDPAIVSMAEKYTRNIVRAPNVKILNGDARTYIKRAERKYDIILVTQPEPSTAFLNRYYSMEFFRDCKRIMNPGGVISTGLPVAEGYLSKEELPLSSVLFSTMKAVFGNVLIFPGGKNYFIGSDSILTLNIIQHLQQKIIENLYVNEYYFDEQMLKQRNEYLMKSIGTGGEVNRDFRPIEYFYQLKYYLSHFEQSKALYILLAFFIMLIIVIRPDRIKLGMMAGGFAASSMELVLIFALEILYGYIFMVVGLVVTIFMAGLAAGVYGSERIKYYSRQSFGVMLIISAFISLIISATIQLLQIAAPASPVILFVLTALIFLVSIFTGLLFGNASRVNQSQPVSKISSVYSADLAGSAMGSIIVSVMLLPLLGVHNVCFITAALSVLAGISILVIKPS